jgi:uncharacterized protein YwgA
MTQINELAYFLNSVKDTLPFKDEKDFRKKIDESKDFRIRVQKLVYLSKFFGWENNYHFNFHENGPYSCELSKDYKKLNVDLSSISSEIRLKINSLKAFMKNQPNDFLEATSTILYYINKINPENINENNILDTLTYLKPHIHKIIILESYRKIKEYNLIDYEFLNNEPTDLSKEIVFDKLDGLISIFENYEVCSNQMLFLGSLDYFRLALKRENLDKQRKDELLKVIFDYGEYIENYYFTNQMRADNFPYYDLTPIEEKFDSLQDYISDLGILPRLYDEDVDLNIFLE